MVSSPGPVIRVLSYSMCVGSSSCGLQVAQQLAYSAGQEGANPIVGNRR